MNFENSLANNRSSTSEIELKYEEDSNGRFADTVSAHKRRY